VVAGTVCGTGRADPLAREFLNGLRERGYADMALEYLDRLEKNPRCPPELRRSLLYERGQTLVLAGRIERDPALQETHFNDAQTILKEFITKNPKDPLVDTATDALGNILLERARSKIDQAARPKNEAKKPQLLAQGRKFYDDASGVFQTRLAGIRRKLLDPKYKNVDPQANPALADERDALRGAYVQSQLMSATILRMKAETYDKGSAEFKAGMKAAAEQYDDVYKKYRTRLAGLYARLYQARCYHQIGGKEDTDEAIVLFEELLEQPYKAEPLRAFRTKVLRMALECWLDAPPKKQGEPKNYMPAIQASAAWEQDGRPNEDKDDDWLAFRYWLAKVYFTDANARDDADNLKKKHKEEAARLAKHVAKYTGEYKKDAQALLQDTGVLPPGGKIEPTDFAEARSAGRDALDQVQLLRYNIDKLSAQLPKATGDKQKQLEQQIAKFETDLAAKQADAVDYFRMALALADEDTSLDDKNTIYYFLCYLNYRDAEYYDAAVIGEFLARHYPSGVGAKNCAKIAMASYLKLYKATDEEDKSFEIERAVDIADYIVRKWPTQPEAQEALATLIPFMIKLGRLDDAEGYLQKIDEKSPKRGEAELTTGQAMWSKYLFGMQDIRNAEKAIAAGEAVDESKLPKQEELDDLKKRAETTLANGIERMRQSAAADVTLALAALSLAQIYVDTQQPAKAVELLEDENIGPKALVDKSDPAAEKEAYKIETYKVALRAYIGALPTVAAEPQKSEVMMTKAEGVMNALKKLMGGTPDGQRRLIGIYISLATDIEKQIQNAPPEAKGALIKGFEVFLTRVGDATTDVKEMFWVAQTLYALAEAADEGGLQLTADAQRFYNKAITAYNKILDLSKTNKEITPEMVLQVQMRLATTLRRLGQYRDAIDLFEDILKKKNMMLNVQVEAAKTYQEWGAVGDPVVFDRAILGGRTNKANNKYTIWGWGKVATQTAPNKEEEGGDKYEDIFYDARYNLSRCRYLKAKKTTNEKDRKKTLQLAKNDIALTYRFYPDLGGEASKTKFDGVLRNIQKELGEKQLGLEGLGELKKGPDLLKSEEEEKE
jgi:hypothetical protein